MPPVGFEHTNSAGERPQTYALDRAATGTGRSYIIFTLNFSGVRRLAKSDHQYQINTFYHCVSYYIFVVAVLGSELLRCGIRLS